MKKLLCCILLLFSLTSIINARGKYLGFARKGGKVVKTSSTTSYKLMETYPFCTITVYLTGTTTLAAIYSDNAGTVKANPFTSNSDASYFFYANNGKYDIKFSGTGIATPFTESNIIIMDIPPIAAASIRVFDVADYGDIPNDGISDNAAFQAAIAAADANGGGTVYFKNGVHNITGLTLTPGAGQHKVALLGESELGSILSYNGSSGTALTLFNCYNIRLSTFSILNANGIRGTSIGIGTSGSSFGTNVHGFVIDSILIDGFHFNYSTADGSGRTSSEITFINLLLQNSDECWRNADFNGLNFSFINLQTAFCGIGVNAATAGVFIHSGAGARNGKDFVFRNGGTFDLQDWRTEGWDTNVVDFGGSPSIHIRNLDVNQSFPDITSGPNTDYTSTAIIVGGNVTIDSSFIQGRIKLGDGGGNLVLKNSIVKDTVTNSPFYAVDSSQGSRYSLQNVQVIGGFWPDVISGVVPAGFPKDSINRDNTGMVAFQSEIDTSFPAQIAKTQELGHKSYLIKRTTLGATAGNFINIGTITTLVNSVYINETFGTKEFLIRISDATGTIRTFAILLNADDMLAFSPIYNTWQEVASINAAPFRSGSYALDIKAHDPDIDIRLRRVTNSSGAQIMEGYLETFHLADGFTVSHTTGVGATVSGKIALQQASDFITLTPDSVTPSVRYGNNFKIVNTVSTTYTNFTNGQNGQKITIVADANTIFANGATISTGTGANITAINGYTYSFILDGTIWRRVN